MLWRTLISFSFAPSYGYTGLISLFLKSSCVAEFDCCIPNDCNLLGWWILFVVECFLVVFFVCLVFFQFYQQSGWKVQFLREWLGFVLRALITSKISCTWSVMCFCWNCVLMTVAGQMHQTHLYCMEPDVYQLLLCPFTSSVSCLIAY